MSATDTRFDVTVGSELVTAVVSKSERKGELYMVDVDGGRHVGNIRVKADHMVVRGSGLLFQVKGTTVEDGVKAFIEQVTANDTTVAQERESRKRQREQERAAAREAKAQQPKPKRQRTRKAQEAEVATV